jgi:elongation factor P
LTFVACPLTLPAMAVVATQIKKGQCFQYNGEKLMVIDLDHRTPGKGNAIILVNCRSLQTGKTKTIRFASSDKVDIVIVDRQKLEFSYTDGTGYFFMNPVTFDTIELSGELLGDATELLVENLAIDVLFIEDQPMTIDLPSQVELTVKDSSEGIKGDTANNPLKPAILETGLEVQVPLFVKPGDRLKIDSRTKKYVSRV